MKLNGRILPVALLLLSACATSTRPSQDAYLTDQGFREISRGNYSQAEANLLVSLNLKPENPRARLYLAEVYRLTGRMDQAKKMYEEVIAHPGEDRWSETARAGLIASGGSIVVPSPDQGGEIREEPKGWVLRFGPGKWDRDLREDFELDEIVTFLKENPEIELEIRGHTDSVGSEKLNNDLSELRAKRVWEYLVRKGVEEQRLTWAGYGSSRPVAPNDTTEGRAENRRVELRPNK
jgi:outer membrane protein OmpA-like peptidoglycan-associated protein